MAPWVLFLLRTRTVHGRGACNQRNAEKDEVGGEKAAIAQALMGRSKGWCHGPALEA